MTLPGKSDRLLQGVAWALIGLELWEAWRMAKFNRRMRRSGASKADLRWLKDATEGEGRRLAEMVRRGDVTRAQLEQAVRETGDGEPAYALKLLDEWGIK